MQVKNIIDEDFSNFKYSSMFIAACYCDFKCCKEQNLDISICQNSALAALPNIQIKIDDIIDRYIQNPITKAIVIGGLEPFKQFNNICNLIWELRLRKNNDYVVIYTGYELDEISDFVNILEDCFTNIILKTGRYIPNQEPHFDEVLGVNLISNNQKGVIIC